MTENVPEITQELVQSAEAIEQAALEEAQLIHLRKRVVLLRVQLNHANEKLNLALKEIDRLRESTSVENDKEFSE